MVEAAPAATLRKEKYQAAPGATTPLETDRVPPVGTNMTASTTVAGIANSASKQPPIFNATLPSMALLSHPSPQVESVTLSGDHRNGRRIGRPLD
ncbi:hypothetical protein FISHEDRAFT_68735 [Fistulina hepatica ATCC 64428]|uniref:Uncharacterized protein n=1 Tax=Fistulina hepatica ATCC 64428 TaxID=1128425 RepID=A0A0D7AS46_9AGAR|nr:hypothetical protein FISHEDRAFT_68735 [Fistulina hepatica ATCC 64428]